MSSDWWSAGQRWLEQEAAKEAASQRRAWTKAGRSEKTFRYNPPEWHRDAVAALGRNDEETFKAIKLGQLGTRGLPPLARSRHHATVKSNLFDAAPTAVQQNMIRDVQEMARHETGRELDEDQAHELARRLLARATSRESLYRVSTARLRSLVEKIAGSARHHATKKSPAQLDREIAEAIELSKSGKGHRPSKLGGDYFTVVLPRAKPESTNEWNRLPVGWDSQVRGAFPTKYAAYKWAREKLLPGAPFTIRYVPLER